MTEPEPEPEPATNHPTDMEQTHINESILEIPPTQSETISVSEKAFNIKKKKKLVIVVPSTEPSTEPMKPKILDEIWKHIIAVNDIDIEFPDSCVITSEQIKNSKQSWPGKCNQFEPRLLCKMDNEKSRPEIFRKHNICMISVKNGTYLLIKENIYVPLMRDISVPNIINTKNDSLILNIGDSETSMLDKLYYDKILENVIGEPIKYGPMLGGRHRCNFDTTIGSHSITIKGSQYETDGCYETENYVCIVEAKSMKCDNFNIRQLYYPFREVYKEVGDTRQIICLFVYKDNENIIHIHKFKWNNYKKMMDIVNIGYHQFYYQL